MAQPPDTLWTRNYGGPGAQTPGSVVQTADGGFAICGSNNSGAYLVRTNSTGDTIWTRKYDGYEYEVLSAYSVIQTSNDGFLLAGRRGRYDDNIEEWFYSFYVISVDSNGDVLWSRDYGDWYNYEEAMRGEQAPDGSFVIAGITKYLYGQFEIEYNDLLLVRVDSEGDTIWSQRLGQFEIDEKLRNFCLSSNGTMVLFGTNGSWYDSTSETFMLSLDLAGDTLWFHTYADFGGMFLIKGENNGYVLMAAYAATEVEHSYLIIETNGVGDVISTDTLVLDAGIRPYYFDQAENGDGIVIAGFSTDCNSGNIDFVVVRYDSFLNLDWEKCYGTSEDDWASNAITTSDGGVMIVGRNYEQDRYHDIYVVRTEPIDGLPTPPRAPVPTGFTLTAYPNPFNSTLSISLSVPTHQEVTVTLYDLLGREVDVIHRGRLETATLSYTTPPSLASGIYFLRAATHSQTQTQKVVLLK